MMYLKLFIAFCIFVPVYNFTTTSVCESKICIHKCCPLGQYVYKKTSQGFVCSNYLKLLNFSTVTIYNEDVEETDKMFDSVFDFYPGTFNKSQEHNIVNVERLNFIPRLTENGELLLESPNDYQRWTKVSVGNFCIDYKIKDWAGPDPSVRFWPKLSDSDFPQISTQGYFRFSIFATVIFLLLTILVQLNATELKVLYIPILMAYLTCLVVSSSLLFVIERLAFQKDACIYITTSIYLFCLITCCWMVVMSFDIWIASRDFRRSVPVNQNRKTFKFLMYCAFAIGLPMVLTSAFYILNRVDMTSVPWFITPQVPQRGCFLSGGRKILYLYVPMLILIAFNWLFSIMTAVNIYLKSQKRSFLPRFTNLSR